MKILLIYPPVSLFERPRWSDFIPIYPPLGLAYIARVLEQAGYDVRIIDAKAERLSIDKILKRVSEFNPNIVGLSSSTPDFCITTSLAKKIKSLGNYTIFIGGPHVSALPEETIKEECFDYGIIGEGEHTAVELAGAISSGASKERLSGIKGIIFNNGSKIIRTSPRPYIENLDTIPFPARHLLPDAKRYRYSWYKHLPTVTIITTRGCPYQCIFCDRAVFGNRLRMRSIDNIMGEIEILVNQYGIRGIDIVDDLFTVSQERVEEFCSQLISRKLKVAWSCMGRVDCMTPEILKIMKKSGCWQIAYGIESGNQRVLDLIKKNITLEMAERAIRWTKEAKIRASGLFMIGLPADTKETMQETLEFAKKLPVDRLSFCITQPFPGSELYKTALARGEILKDVGYEYYGNTHFYKNIPYIPKGLDVKTLIKYRHKFYREFYLRPSYFFRQIFKYSEVKGFPARIASFLKAIF
ncbi:MAG: cobalamin B12-binding domain-containing protein [Candidatus Omnitrophica bacterium]|nr:cobalamin B12-binding domain-containing protein [Candidatus Omnitrophota bacterium]